MHTTSTERHTILVAISLDAAGAVALVRASTTAKAFNARLVLAYVLPLDHGERIETALDVRARVRGWAATEAKVHLEQPHILVRLGDPLQELERVAGSVGASLIVVPATIEPDAIERLATSTPRGVLVARPPRTTTELVAATDLYDLRLPVVKTAAHLARGLAARVTVVHNLEGDATLVALALGDLIHRRRALGRLAIELMPFKATAPCRTADAILQVARSKNADITVVGVRRGRGRTLRSLAALSAGSILAVPLASRS